jgi:hypothetical protein
MLTRLICLAAIMLLAAGCQCGHCCPSHSSIGSSIYDTGSCYDRGRWFDYVWPYYYDPIPCVNYPPEWTGGQVHLQPLEDREQWHTVARGSMAEVYAHKTLYDLPDTQRVLVRFRVRNTTEREIAVDLLKYETVIRPSGWTAASGPAASAAQTADGRPTLSEAKRAAIIHEYRQGILVVIPPLAAVDYFIDVSARNNPKVPKTGTLAARMGGELTFTDGRLVEAIDPCCGPLLVPLPARMADIPVGEIIVEPSGAARLIPSVSGTE